MPNKQTKKTKNLNELELSQRSSQIEVSFGKQDILSSRKTKTNCQQSSTGMFYIFVQFSQQSCSTWFIFNR